ncbi:MAG TPA: Rne/Rng family ribonuclease [Chthonomonas sp.]|nr:Rne/Rng family ribonuclease [Chthonomonas sp.]HLI48467.1 Rne/Rng family ribonuclease [Chthonomonas sp.]
MVKEIIVNVGERETRIAVLEDGKLMELQIERSERLVGSLYKCRVMNVLPGMDAAFVDIGLERNAFLYVGDVLPNRVMEQEPLALAKEQTQETAEFSSGAQEAILPIGIAEVANGAADVIDADMDAEALEEDEDAERAQSTTEEIIQEALETAEAEEEATEEEPEATSRLRWRPRRIFRRSALRRQSISDVLKVGQELLVQVIKGPRSTKGARVSTRITLPGRYVVLMPGAELLGVSRKIEDAKERERLKRIGEKLRRPGFGLIVRTEAEDKTEAELAADLQFLLQSWQQIQQRAQEVEAPALVMQDLTLLYKTIRDIFSSDVQRLVIDDPAEYEKANALLERISPKLIGRVQLYDGTQPIFDYYKIEEQIERNLRRKVYLKSGGSLVIDETEALTVIDVNTSKNVGGSSLAETIFKTNLEAAEEIARQLRLRDIGGIIVIDFIDMSNPRDRIAVVKALEAALKRDRSRTKVSPMSRLGLVEMTRKRTADNLLNFLSEECPLCKGRGHLPSAESVSLEVERDLRRMVADPKYAKKEAFRITCHPDVAEFLIGPDGATVEEMERELEKALYIRASEEAVIEKYLIEAGEIASFEKSRAGIKRAQVVECRIRRSLLKEGNHCIGWADGQMLDLDDGYRFIGQRAKARILLVRRSYAMAQLIPGTNRPIEEK